jgi:hypothetical protein
MYKDDYPFPEFMSSADFWCRNIDNPHAVISSPADIDKFNAKISSKLSCLYSLDTSEGVISSKNLLQYIKSYKLPSKEMYDSDGKFITSKFYDRILNNMNIDEIKASNPVKYGITVRKTSIRSFPTGQAIYSNKNDSTLNNFDRFQETGCFAFEPVLIFHKSRDRQWYFARLYNYTGWIKAEDIALAQDKNAIFNYSFCKDFITITSKEVSLNLKEESSCETIKLGMGTKLNYLHNDKDTSTNAISVKVPYRDKKGFLSFQKAYINKNEDFIKGYLPYTRYNILKQALKFLDTYYDWGDKFQGKDCSSFLLTVYRCFGFLLPRNAGQQENSFIDTNNSIVFNKTDNLETRYCTLGKLKPGTALFMKEHAMLYLGKYNDNHYMIHSFLGYAVPTASGYEARTALCVAISPVDILTAGGVPFIKRFTSAVHFQ